MNKELKIVLGSIEAIECKLTQKKLLILRRQ
jgi:hypothetical protein